MPCTIFLPPNLEEKLGLVMVKTDLEVGKNRHNITPPPDTYNLSTFI